MQEMPHHYRVTASASATGNVDLDSPGLATIPSAPPAEFGGPGNLWSPETLLAAAIADCFILSFRAIARASRLDWNTLECDVEAVLDRDEGVTRFTKIIERASLGVPAGTDPDKARRILEKAEKACLITNSLTAAISLEADISVAAD